MRMGRGQIFVAGALFLLSASWASAQPPRWNNPGSGAGGSGGSGYGSNRWGGRYTPPGNPNRNPALNRTGRPQTPSQIQQRQNLLRTGAQARQNQTNATARLTAAASRMGNAAARNPAALNHTEQQGFESQGGFEPLQISLGLGLGGILFFAGLIYWGNRFKTIRRTTIILYGLGGGALVVISSIAVNHSGSLPELVRLVLLLSAALGLFVLAGATPAAIGLLADVTEGYPEDRGAIMGLYSVFLGLGQIIGSLIAGFAANAFGLDGVLVASLVLLAIAVVPLGSLRRYEHYLGPERAEVLGQTQ